jgi:hypothetical protein
MALDPFNSVGGYSVSIPPVQVVDQNGNILSNIGNIANLSSQDISASGNITANTFYGNLVGNITANITVPGVNTSVIFNDSGLANASGNFTFDKVEDRVTVTGSLSTNALSIGAGNNQLITQNAVFAITASMAEDQVLHRVFANAICSIDYTVVATDATSNTRQTSKLVASVLGGNVGYYEYGTINMNGGVGDFKVQYNTGNVELVVTPLTSYSTSYKIMVTSYKES